MSKLVLLFLLSNTIVFGQDSSYFQSVDLIETNANKCLRLSEKVLEESKNKSLRFQAQANCLMGRVGLKLLSIDSSLYYFKTAHNLINNSNELFLHEVQLYLGKAYILNEETVKGIHLLEKAANYYESINDWDNYTLSKTLIAEANRIKVSVPKGVKVFEEIIHSRIFEQVSPKTQAYVFNRYAAILNVNRLEAIDSSLYFSKKSLEISNKHQFLNLKASSINEIAAIDLKNKNYKLALKKFEEVVSIFKQTGNLIEEMNAQLNYLNTLFFMKRYQELFAQAKLTLEVNLEHNWERNLMYNYFLLSTVSEKLKDYENAHYYLLEGYKLEINLNAKTQIKKIAEATNHFEIAIKNRKLKEANQQQENDALQKKLYFSSIVFLILLMFVLIYFIKKSKKNNLLLDKQRKELQVYNDTLGKTLDQKEILLKEVHHRVKNNMNMVSSLLNLKSNLAENQEVKEALLDGKERIYSMALAHQRMYQNDEYEKIDVTEYCREILTTLTHSAGQKEKDSFELIGESLFLPIERAQALGFITHELISNSFKHAWVGEVNRFIQVRFEFEGDYCFLCYIDNGKGVDSEFDINNIKSLGMKLVKSFVERQLEGEVIFNTAENFKLLIVFKVNE